MLWYSNYCYWCLLLLYNCGIKILPIIFLNRFFPERNFLIEKMCKFNEKFKFWPFCSFKQNFYHRGRNKITESIYILKLSTEHQCLRKGQLYLLYINKSTLSLFVNLMWNQCLSIKWAMSDLPVYILLSIHSKTLQFDRWKTLHVHFWAIIYIKECGWIMQPICL